METLPNRQAQAGSDSYDSLPEPIKLSITPKEWAWLSDEEKVRYCQEATEPEYDGDD